MGWMSQYIIFGGTDSNEMKVRITAMPKSTRAEERTEEVKVPGRNGTLTLMDGGHKKTYESYTDTIEGVLLPAADEEAVRKWLSGGGWLIRSDTPTKKQRVRFTDSITYERISRNTRHRRFKATMKMQPLKYEVNQTLQTLYLSPSYLMNPGTLESEPVITVYGRGDVTLSVNGKTLHLFQLDGKITIDSELGDAYKDNLLMNHKTRGEFPELAERKNLLEWVGDVDKIEVLPNWRWL